MTDQTASDPAAQNVLVESPDIRKQAKDAVRAPVIAQVQDDYGIHPLRQMREMFFLRWGSRRIRTREYYALRLFRKDLTFAERHAFIGQQYSNWLNSRFNPKELTRFAALIGDKVFYTELLAKLGLPTTHTQAVFADQRELGALTTLRSAAELTAFLKQTASYPLFCKPTRGSLSVGSVRLDRLEGEVLILGNGGEIPLETFVAEVETKYASGYLLQTAVTQHPRCIEMVGDSVACLRIVTAITEDVAEPAYVVWKLPASDAMSDNFWQSGSLVCMIDRETGRIESCRQGTGVDTRYVDTHPVTGAQIVGQHLPFFEDAKALAVQAHNLMPQFGVLGFDVALGPDGAVIIECNNNPAHLIYQIAADEGILCPTLAPIWTQVLARQRARSKKTKKRRFVLF